MQTLHWSLKVKNAPKLISMYLKGNYILIIKKQKILVNLMAFLNQLKTFMKNFIPRENLQNCLLLDFKIPNTKKITNERFRSY